jgi:hypothetical protein
VTAHRECLEHAAGLVQAQADARKDAPGADTLTVAALKLKAEAAKAAVAPADIAEERAAIARMLQERLEDMARMTALPRDLEAILKELARHIAKDVTTGAHAPLIEVMREEKRLDAEWDAKDRKRKDR